MEQAAGGLQAGRKGQAAEAQRRAIEEMTDDVAKLGELQRRLEKKAKDPDYAKQKDDQDKTAEGTDSLVDAMEQASSGDKPPTPGQPAAASAAKSMKQASQSLGQSKAGQAGKQQEEALEDLEKARRELSETIAEIEETIQEEALIEIEAMLQTILQAQREINTETAQVADKHGAEGYLRPQRLRLNGLAERQGQQAGQVGRIVDLLKKEGTTVVFPVMLEQIREDMTNVQSLLGKHQAGLLTQSIQDDIIKNLLELIDALQKEISRRNSEGDQPPGDGDPGPSPLVPPVAELKLLRALQKRINERTVQLDAQKTTDGQAEMRRLQHKLLSDRQAHVAKLARRIAQMIKQAKRR